MDARADYLIFIEFEKLSGEVVLNGPEHLATGHFGKVRSQRPVSLRMIRLLNEEVNPAASTVYRELLDS
ncbi:hypothetical protein HFN97_35765 [Rhizobium laguerreae]|nr:hypothetical protein [Rhizobium laguerreae]